MRTSEILSAFALSCGLFAMPMAGQTAERASYLITGNVGGLVLFDRFERRLSVVDQAKLAPFVPMRIVEQGSLMGDGISKMMVVEIDRVRHAIQLDDRGRILVASGTSNARIVQDAVVMEDTARVAAPEGIRLDRSGGGSVHLPRGSLIKRYFAKGEMLLAGTVAEPHVFGWVASPQRSALEPVAASGRRPTIPDETVALREKVAGRLTEVNDYLKRLYRAFSVKTGRVFDAPAWRMEEGNGAIVCTLEGASGPDVHPESSRMLANEIRSFAFETDADIVTRPGVIEIRSRE